MVGVPPPHGPDARSSWSTRTTRRPARAARTARRRASRASRPGATASHPRSTTSGGARCTIPAKKQAGPDAARSRGRSATSSRSIRPNGPWTSGASPASRIREPSCPLDWVRTKDAPGGACSSSASWVADHGIDAAGPVPRRSRPAARRPPRVGHGRRAAAAAGRDGARRGAAARASRSTTRSSPIQGPPGSGKTYTGARMICTCCAPASGSGSPRQPQGHRQPAAEPSSRRPAGRHRRPAGPEAATRTRSSTTRVTRGEGRDRRPRPGSPTDAPTSPPGPPGCGPREDGRGGRRPVRRRGRPDLAGQRPGHRRRDRQPRPARRSAAARPAAPGHAIRPGADRSALAHVLGDDADDAARRGACSSSDTGGCTRTCASSPPRCSTTTGSNRSAHLDVQRVSAIGTIAAGPGPRLLACRRPAPTTSRPRRPTRWPTCARCSSRAARPGSTRRATPAGRPGTTS